MSVSHAFLKAIGSNPRDFDLRLIFADWLDECGDPRGELIRIEQEIFVTLQGVPGLDQTSHVDRLARRADVLRESMGLPLVRYFALRDAGYADIMLGRLVQDLFDDRALREVLTRFGRWLERNRSYVVKRPDDDGIGPFVVNSLERLLNVLDHGPEAVLREIDDCLLYLDLPWRSRLEEWQRDIVDAIEGSRW